MCSLAEVRGQTEPIAALVAVFAVCVGVTVYAGAHAGLAAVDSDRAPAAPTADRAASALTADGAVNRSAFDDETLPDQIDAAPDGYEYRLTIQVDGERVAAGPDPPADVDRTQRPIAVETAPGEIRPGLLVVEVWS